MALALERSLRQLTLRPSSTAISCRHISTSRSRPDNGRQRPTIRDLFDELPQSSSSRPTTTLPPRPNLSATSDLLSSMNKPTSSSTSTRSPSANYLEQSISTIKSTVNENIVTPQLTRQREQDLRDLDRNYTAADLDRQVGRIWRAGNVYAPHDLSGVEASKWKKQRRREDTPRWDAIDQLGLDPVSLYKNYSIMAEYTSQTGRIKPRSETGLRPKNQRRMAKAIRRAIGIGLIPGTYRHPQWAAEMAKDKGVNKFD